MVLSLLIILKLKQMANVTKQMFDDVLNAIDSETNRVAQALEDLKGSIEGNGLDAETEAEVLSKLDAIKSKLTGIAADPNNPVPNEPVEPEEPIEPE